MIHNYTPRVPLSGTALRDLAHAVAEFMDGRRGALTMADEDAAQLIIDRDRAVIPSEVVDYARSYLTQRNRSDLLALVTERS